MDFAFPDYNGNLMLFYFRVHLTFVLDRWEGEKTYFREKLGLRLYKKDVTFLFHSISTLQQQILQKLRIIYYSIKVFMQCGQLGKNHRL